MTIVRKAGGANVPAVVRRRAGSGWVTSSFVRRRVGGAWVETSLMALTLSPAEINASRSNGSSGFGITVTINGGSGSRTISWAWVEGGGGMSLQFTTAARVQINASGTNELREGVIRVTVTDTITGLVAIKDASVAVQFGTPV